MPFWAMESKKWIGSDGMDGWSLLVNSFLRAPSVPKNIVLTKIVCSSGLEVVTFFRDDYG